jgi:hypothetical protein
MNDNLSMEDVYIAYRKAQSTAKGRPYRIPKDFNKFYETKLSDNNKENLRYLTGYFNTKWKEIDPEKYFECGFELFKTFTYHMFLKPNVINLYIQRDKILKRDLQDGKRGITESLKFVKSFMTSNNINSIVKYCRKKIDNRSLPVIHYLENKIDKFFIVYLIRKGFLLLQDDERSYMPYVVDNYRQIVLNFNEIPDFIGRIDKIIDKE